MLIKIGKYFFVGYKKQQQYIFDSCAYMSENELEIVKSLLIKNNIKSEIFLTIINNNLGIVYIYPETEDDRNSILLIFLEC